MVPLRFPKLSTCTTHSALASRSSGGRNVAMRVGRGRLGQAPAPADRVRLSRDGLTLESCLDVAAPREDGEEDGSPLLVRRHL